MFQLTGKPIGIGLSAARWNIPWFQAAKDGASKGRTEHVMFQEGWFRRRLEHREVPRADDPWPRR